MPTSQHFQISRILDLVVLLNPKSVLDIGTGFGKYGLLCREFLELWDGKETYGKFRHRIEGIEIFEKYLTPVHAYVYDRVHVGDAAQVVQNLESSFELALLIDVLEHFDRPAGEKLVADILSRCRYLIASVPRDNGQQGEMYENSHETHLAQWTARDLLRLAPGFSCSDRMSHIVLLSRDGDLTRARRAFAPPVWIRAKRSLADIVRR